MHHVVNEAQTLMASGHIHTLSITHTRPVTHYGLNVRKLASKAGLLSFHLPRFTSV